MHRSVNIKKLAIASQSDPTTYLYAARALRDFGDGFVAVLLPVYLTALGLGALEVGVVATLALFGSALMTFPDRQARGSDQPAPTPHRRLGA